MTFKRSFVAFLGAFALLAATIGVPGSSPAAAAAPTVVPTMAFGEPTVSGVQGYGFEQNGRVDPNTGEILTSAPDSLSSATTWVWHSIDGGKTFKWIPGATQPQGKLPTCPGGGDSELAIDSASHFYLNDLTLANFSTSRSDDHGKTFQTSCTGVPGGGVDRQWYATHGDPTNGGQMVLAYDQVAQTQPITCPNGTMAQPGQNVLTYNVSPASAAAGSTAGIQFGPPQVLSCDEGIMGNDEIFDYGSRGGLKAFVIHDNIALTSITMSRCDLVGISTTAPTGLTHCMEFPVSSFPGSVTGGSFATMSIDRSGSLYAVWEQAPGASANITGNTTLMFAKSNTMGRTWTVRSLPTPGLLNNVFAWIAAGSEGKVDAAWYGTSAAAQGTGGPDTTSGDWGLYSSQTLDSGVKWSIPVLASGHFNHRGTIQTVMGGQTGDRTLGDYLNVRIGRLGEANITYSDSNNIDEANTPQAMYVRQNGGTSVYTGVGTVHLPAAPRNSVSDKGGDATFDSNGSSSANIPNLDLLKSSISQPDAGHYLVTMKVADLTSLAPPTTAGGNDLLWQTQWHVPSATDPNGGKIFFAYMESDNGAAPTCWDGENATDANGGGVSITYPGAHQITASGCSYMAALHGSIRITVPIADVTEANPISPTLFSVTSSTQLLTAPASSAPSQNGIGGLPFSLVDVMPAYDFVP